jgi:hypothetical protein
MVLPQVTSPKPLPQPLPRPIPFVLLFISGLLLLALILLFYYISYRQTKNPQLLTGGCLFNPRLGQWDPRPSRAAT